MYTHLNGEDVVSEWLAEARVVHDEDRVDESQHVLLQLCVVCSKGNKTERLALKPHCISSTAEP